MTDVLTQEQRRLNMSRVRGQNTKPELILRRGLHARGLRFRLHRKDLPGTPDLVFPIHGTIILVHGCFWHWHSCPMFKWPTTRADFWRAKIGGNRERDQFNLKALQDEGWRVLIVWECALRGPRRWKTEDVFDHCEEFIRSPTSTFAEIGGSWKSCDRRSGFSVDPVGAAPST